MYSDNMKCGAFCAEKKKVDLNISLTTGMRLTFKLVFLF